MKPAQLRQWTASLLEAHGAQVETQGNHLLSIVPPPDSPLGARPLVLAFSQRGLQENPRSELATVGNPVFDRVVELALTQGRTGIRYRQLPKKARVPDPAGAVALDDRYRGFGEPVPVYVPVYHHVFTTRPSLEEYPDEIETVAIDGATHEPLAVTKDLPEYWEGLASEPNVGWHVEPSLPVPEDIVRRCLEVLERRLQRRVAKMQRIAAEHLATNRANIDEYYLKLIAEAKVAPLRGARGQESREEKVQLLQLDWKRRTEEAGTFWAPRVEVALTAVGVVMDPRYRIPVLGRNGRAAGSVFYAPEHTAFQIPPGLAGVQRLDSERTTGKV